ncbi:MAG: STAS domain-containing protein [Leptospiraceae bacterium]|nr:STAS domain-containing protein [Leptospiraceae bacterium]
MEFEIHHVSEGATILPRGELTIYKVAQVQKQLIEIVQTADRLFLDLEGLDSIDTAGLQLLMSLKLYCHQHNKELQITNHPGALIALLDLYGLAGFFGDKIKLGPEQRQTWPFAYGTRKISLDEVLTRP